MAFHVCNIYDSHIGDLQSGQSQWRSAKSTLCTSADSHRLTEYPSGSNQESAQCEITASKQAVHGEKGEYSGSGAGFTG
jgi:hypothetical protein